MADFGDYAGQYLTMAREMPRNAAMIGGATEDLVQNRLKRPILEAEAAYAPQITMAKLTGTPFEQQKLGIEYQDILAKQALAKSAQDRLFAVDAETRRRDASTESRQTKQQADANAIAQYKAALEAYQAGAGPNPGQPPWAQPGGAGAAGGPISLGNGISMNPQAGGGAAPGGQPGLTADLAGMPAAVRNRVMSQRILSAGANKPLPVPAQSSLSSAAALLQKMVSQRNDFNDYGGYVVPGIGEAVNAAEYLPFVPTGQRDWWKNQSDLIDAAKRHSLYGGGLTGREMEAYKGQNINPAMQNDSIKDYLDQRIGMMVVDLARNSGAMSKTFNPDQVTAATGIEGLGAMNLKPKTAEDFANIGRAYREAGGVGSQDQQGGVQEGATATGPNGQRIVFKGGQWAPM